MKSQFFGSSICKSGVHCQACRDKETGRNFRSQIPNSFEPPAGGGDFDCPDKPWGYIGKAPATAKLAIVAERPRPTIRQVTGLAKAAVIGKYVSLEVLQKRLAICDACPAQRQTKKGDKWCSKCGCGMSDSKKVTNLAAYEENLPEWGCKFAGGSRWKEKGL